jgi:hypothetical protein
MKSAYILNIFCEALEEPTYCARLVLNKLKRHLGGLGTYPGELLMISNQVQVCAIGCQPLAVIVKTENLLVGKRDATKSISPAIVPILVLVNVVPKMDDIIDRVLKQGLLGEGYTIFFGRI